MLAIISKKMEAFFLPSKWGKESQVGVKKAYPNFNTNKHFLKKKMNEANV